MRTLARIAVLPVVATLISCQGPAASSAWLVEEMEIRLYHSSTRDPGSGAIYHVEYCGVKLTRGSEEIHLVYRPIDFPGRDPGFDKGDRVRIDGLDGAKDFGALDGPDYWISDVVVDTDGF